VMRETYKRVHGKVTAKAIKQTRERIIEPEPAKPAPKPKIEPEKTAPEPDDHHYYCDDEEFFKQKALAAWDKHPPKNEANRPSMEFGWWFADLLEEHWLCFDPYVQAGWIASWLDCERNANGGNVLEDLAAEIRVFFYRLNRGDDE